MLSGVSSHPNSISFGFIFSYTATNSHSIENSSVLQLQMLCIWWGGIVVHSPEHKAHFLEIWCLRCLFSRAIYLVDVMITVTLWERTDIDIVLQKWDAAGAGSQIQSSQEQKGVFIISMGEYWMPGLQRVMHSSRSFFLQ